MVSASREYYLAVEPDLLGNGTYSFSSQTIIAQQGDQINITIRNPTKNSFPFQIQGLANTTIKPATTNQSALVPTDNIMPSFTVTQAGIFDYEVANVTAMQGELVVLPSDWPSYDPSPQQRAFIQTAIPDFAGDGYDEFYSGLMVANRGDNISITVKSIDTSPHGFALPAYGINQAIQPAQQLPNGSTIATSTTIPTFTASTAGIFRFACTVYCGPGHIEMTGNLAVLPTGNNSYLPTADTAYRYITLKPDFAGPGYSKLLPDQMLVNQGDLVYIKVRNTDTNSYAFTLSDYGINNETISAAQNATGDITPSDNYLTPFYATQPGTYLWYCTQNNTSIESQAIGYLTILPTLNETSPFKPTVTSETPTVSLILLTAAIGITGLIIGVIVSTLAIRQEQKKTQTNDVEHRNP